MLIRLDKLIFFSDKKLIQHINTEIVIGHCNFYLKYNKYSYIV